MAFGSSNQAVLGAYPGYSDFLSSFPDEPAEHASDAACSRGKRFLLSLRAEVLRRQHTAPDEQTVVQH
jgi:hypothetical protein